MKISFAKIANNQMPFELSLNGVNFNGELKRINQNLVSCKGKIVVDNDPPVDDEV